MKTGIGQKITSFLNMLRNSQQFLSWSKLHLILAKVSPFEFDNFQLKLTVILLKRQSNENL